MPTAQGNAKTFAIVKDSKIIKQIRLLEASEYTPAAGETVHDIGQNENNYVIGATFDGTNFTNPHVDGFTDEQHMIYLRQRRDALLMACDWTQSRDVTLPNDSDWQTYRQSLRDLPANTSDPKNPTWPTKPS